MGPVMVGAWLPVLPAGNDGTRRVRLGQVSFGKCCTGGGVAVPFGTSMKRDMTVCWWCVGVSTMVKKLVISNSNEYVMSLN